MKVSAIVSNTGDGWLAQCEEVDCAGEGASEKEALAQLHAALEDYFHQAEAIAPPAQTPHETIEIIVVDGPSGAVR